MRTDIVEILTCFPIFNLLFLLVILVVSKNVTTMGLTL